ncbi:hypothetical protein ACO11K_002451 [Bacillus cytotoxicus]|uniref:Rap family tetratricopeptide repeat protein n=1 Tax=Bacillus cereus group sp. BfR-BA-01492 TaxID=2920361 RepID=UPI001F56EC4A|nr:Rap family tetratricopeptide repeat protein [Bacillus cereus group sp. BfR-BA-01492]EMA6345120.1 hypothetical protein [Bacillus cytotoxicus]
MSAHIITKEQIRHSLDAWYQSMLKQDFVQSKLLKEEIDSKINHIEEDQNIWFYYSLLNFRHKVLMDSMNVSYDEFDKIDSLSIPNDAHLTYYYHLFKGIHLMFISNYNDSKKHFEQAEELLKYMSHPIEQAEFNYRIAYFYYQSYEPLLSINYARAAKEEYIKHIGYEVNIALCNNIYGMSCLDLKQYEQAEENFTLALDVFKKSGIERFILMVRHNLGWLYANQNLSSSAIRHLLEVIKGNPNHFKAIFVLAREHYKLGETNIAAELIEKGLNICNKLKNKEFQQRFMILKEMNKNVSSALLEPVILEGISYFEREGLWDCIQEYSEILALQFYKEENDSKASKYFYINNQARKKYLEKGALK